MNRPIFYDATQAFGAEDGAESFDRRFAQSLLRNPTDQIEPFMLEARGLTRLVDRSRELPLQRDRSEESEEALAAARAWILDRGSGQVSAVRRRRPLFSWLPQRSRPILEAPQGAALLKIGLRGWEDPRLAEFLERRSDIVVVAVLGDLWELDFPEYAPAREAKAAQRALRAAERRANAIVTLARNSGGAPALPEAPSLIAETTPEPLDRELAEEPYFVQAGPIEARANTLMILQIWREFAHSGAPVPKLVLAGERGAQIDSIAPMLDWSEAIQPYVIEAPSLDARGIRRLIAHARGLLVPDFAGPDGALARDARRLGTRVIASDLSSIEEKAGPRFERLDPIAGPLWREAILRAANEPARRGRDDAALASWSDWRRGLLALISGL